MWLCILGAIFSGLFLMSLVGSGVSVLGGKIEYGMAKWIWKVVSE